MYTDLELQAMATPERNAALDEYAHEATLEAQERELQRLSRWSTTR